MKYPTGHPPQNDATPTGCVLVVPAISGGVYAGSAGRVNTQPRRGVSGLRGYQAANRASRSANDWTSAD